MVAFLPDCTRLPMYQAQAGSREAKLYKAANKARLAAGREPSLVPKGISQDQAPCSVVGSIILPISVILVAGKPLMSACFLMMSSSLAR